MPEARRSVHEAMLDMLRRGTLVACVVLVACSVPTIRSSPAAKPGCDRNGDYEQRVAC